MPDQYLAGVHGCDEKRLPLLLNRNEFGSTHALKVVQHDELWKIWSVDESCGGAGVFESVYSKAFAKPSLSILAPFFDR